MCWSHYQRWLRYGHPMALPPARDPLARMWENVAQREVGCWLYDTSDLTRPPRFYVDGKRIEVRRLVWEAEVGPLAVDCRLQGLCGTPNCVRPSHQQPVLARAA